MLNSTTDIRKAFDNEGLIPAARLIHANIHDEETAKAAMAAYGQTLLTSGKLATAGHLAWGPSLFTLDPLCCQRVWSAINQYARVIVMGGSGMGKSFTGIARTLLDWVSDPESTTVKLISTTGSHSAGNIFATLKILHEKSSFALPGIPKSESIEYRQGDKRANISIIRISEGQDSSGVLQGFHPLPRQKPHPRFGNATRLRLVLDEIEEIAAGVYPGIDNMQSSIHGTETIKIYGFYNPKDISKRPAAIAEPPGGWGEFDVETGYRGKDEWMSKLGWYVVRLDPAKSENVVERKHIFTGFHTYEGYESLRQYNGGNSINYYVFGRGCYPPDGATCTVISQAIIKNMRGEFVFSGKTIRCASVDIAIDGRDEAVMTVGQYGIARGFKRLVIHADGSRTLKFESFAKEKWVLQIDQQFAIKKGSTEIVATEIRTHCKNLQIEPAWLMIDATGNGAAVLGLLRAPSFWSPDAKGVDFAESATEKKILEEDVWTANEQFEGVHTEVWFAFARWGEFGFLAIAPTVNSDSLESQLSGRRYKLGAGKMLRVEDKDIYKTRINRSPDHADSATILLHLVRTAENVSASMTGQTNVAEKEDELFAGPNPDDAVWLDSGV